MRNYKIEKLDINEAFSPSKGNARDAKKVAKSLEKFFMDHPALATPGIILGVCKYMLAESLTDANFHSYREPVSKVIKGTLSTIMVELDNLGGMSIPVGKKIIINLLDDKGAFMASAAGWSGIGIVEGMALFLDGFGHSDTAQKIVDAFELIWANESVMNEGNAFLAARAKAIEEDAEEFEFNGKKFPVIKEEVEETNEDEIEIKTMRNYKIEKLDINEARSITKISKELASVTSRMKELADEFYGGELGSAKRVEEIKNELRELTPKKKALIAELDDSVAGKDRNIELAIEESLLTDEELLENHLNEKITVKQALRNASDALLETPQGKKFDTEYVYDYLESLERMAKKDPKSFVKDYGDFTINDYIEDVEYNMANESVVTEGKIDEARNIQTKRKYTENHPAKTVGTSARIRNKILEAIKDGKMHQDEFNRIVKELSSDHKRWMKRNSKMFNVSEEGISLTRFGHTILKGLSLNESSSFESFKNN